MTRNDLGLVIGARENLINRMDIPSIDPPNEVSMMG